MHIIQIEFHKLVNRGSYEHKKLGIVVQLAEGESPAEALRRAKAFVEKGLEPPAADNLDIRRARRIMEDPKAFTGYEVERAKELLEKVDQQTQEIPF